jgi:hypothetical protein
MIQPLDPFIHLPQPKKPWGNALCAGQAVNQLQKAQMALLAVAVKAEIVNPSHCE